MEIVGTWFGLHDSRKINPGGRKNSYGRERHLLTCQKHGIPVGGGEGEIGQYRRRLLSGREELGRAVVFVAGGWGVGCVCAVDVLGSIDETWAKSAVRQLQNQLKNAAESAQDENKTNPTRPTNNSEKEKKIARLERQLRRIAPLLAAFDAQKTDAKKSAEKIPSSVVNGGGGEEDLMGRFGDVAEM
jgi:hypothetical protein